MVAFAGILAGLRVAVWHLLHDPAARCTDLGPDHYARHTDTSRKVRGHKRQIEALGYDVTLTPVETDMKFKTDVDTISNRPSGCLND